jgi:hypothetical protein
MGTGASVYFFKWRHMSAFFDARSTHQHPLDRPAEERNVYEADFDQIVEPVRHPTPRQHQAHVPDLCSELLETFGAVWSSDASTKARLEPEAEDDCHNRNLIKTVD